MDSVCQCRGSALERGAGELFLVYAPSRTPTIPTVYVRCPRCMYTISRCRCADSRMIGLPRIATLGHEFLNKMLIRGSRRMDAVAAKSDAVTAWKCTITDAYRRLPALTGADSRCGAFAPSACDRVKPYPSVTGPLPLAMILQSNCNFSASVLWYASWIVSFFPTWYT